MKRSLRKLFAVVLAVAMAFSLVTVASAAGLSDYSDASSVTYKEAVNVMTAAGIFNGISGEFQPTGNFTREQAAKVICYLMLGPSAASRLSTTTSSFSDVDPSRWSAPYIQYCVTKGIINGLGDGTFAPEAYVTGTQFAKLLLTALGYGKQGEYVGPNWEINALTDAISYGILTLDVNYSAPATREQVAQYAFNALPLTFQVWNTTTNAYQDSTATVNTFAKKLNLNRTDNVTVNGVTGHTWKLGTTQIAFYPDEKVIATSTDGTTIATLTDSTSFAFKARLASGFAMYVNGIAAKADTVSNSFVAGEYAYDTTTGALRVCTAAGTGGATGTGTFTAVPLKVGDIVNFIDTNADSLADKITVIMKTVDTIGVNGVKVTAGINGNPDSVVVDLATGSDITGTALTVDGYAGLAYGDVVTYYTDGLGVTHIEKCTATTGKLQGYNSTYNTVKIAGTTYTLSTQTNAKALADYTALGYVNDIVVYTDSNGYAVWVTGAPTAPVITKVVVLAAALVPGNGWTPDHVEARVLFPDGTTKVVTVSAVDGVNTSAAAVYAEIDESAEQNIFYDYTYNAVTNTYALTTTAGVTTGTDLDVTSGRAVYATGFIGNNTTVFLVRTGAPGAYKYTSYTGIANVPNLKTADIKAVVSGGISTIVYITDPAAAAVSTNTVFFYSLTKTYNAPSAPGAGDDYYEYTAVAGTTPNATVKVLASVDGSITAAGLYTVTYDSNGYVNSATAVAADVPGSLEYGTGTTAAAGGIVGIDGNYYTYTDSTVVYYAAGGFLTTTTVAGIATDTDDEVWGLYNASGALTAIYIVAV